MRARPAVDRRVRRRGVRRGAARARRGAARTSSSSTPTSPPTAASAPSSSPIPIASSSAGSPSRTWSRRPPAWRATGCCRSSTRSRRSSPSRANEQIYNQASEGSKVVYALHYAGLIPAGPGKSHQSIRDISLLAALPERDDRPARARRRRRGRSSAGPSRRRRRASRCASRSARRRAGSSCQADAQAVGRGAVLREGRDAVLALVRAGDAPRGAARRRAAGRERRGVGSRRGDAVAQSLRRGMARRPRWPRFEHVLVLEDHAPVGGLGDRLRAALPGRAIARVRGRGLARLRDARRGAPLPRPGRRVARRADRRPRRRPGSMSAKRAWLVLPDLLSIRVFVDTGILSGLDARLDGELAAVYLVPRGRRRRSGRSACAVPALDGDELTAPARAWRPRPRAASTPGSTAGSATTRSRSA